jgi:hypothetical protein
MKESMNSMRDWKQKRKRVFILRIKSKRAESCFMKGVYEEISCRNQGLTSEKPRGNKKLMN